jgi:8-amino-7-oxononanoate synthase
MAVGQSCCFAPFFLKTRLLLSFFPGTGHNERVSTFEQELQQRLDAQRRQGLWRELRRVDSPQGVRLVLDGRSLLNFSSNDYLGLSSHPALKQAAIGAVEQFGAGSGASRLISGSLAPHHELEETLAAFKGTVAALTFSSGYTAALGTLCAMVGKGDIIVLDKLVHASIVDAARLSGATLRVFRHNDLDNLEHILKWADARCHAVAPGEQRPRILIATESVFSMDGDHAPLAQLVELKDRHGAWLMVDEAHATGLYGAHRRGLAEAAGIADRIEIQMGTLGKAFGASGGYIAGSRTLIDFLVNRARSFIFSTAPVPAAAAAALAAVRIVQSDKGAGLCARLWQRVDRMKDVLSGCARFKPPAAMSAILPLMVGEESQAVAMAGALRERGVFIPAVRFPTVARGAARLRLTLTAAHEDGDIDELARALAGVGGTGGERSA